MERPSGMDGSVMKISKLSRLSGVSVPTIKFYLREQLLRPGTLIARNQAEYDETHLSRLRLIRLLTGIGMMSLASVREVLAAVDGNCGSPHRLAQVVNRALVPEQPMPSASTAAYENASRRVSQLLDELGWKIRSDAPERESLVRVMTALESMGVQVDTATLEPYVDAAERLAVRELRGSGAPNAAGGPTAVVARMVLFEVVFAVLRRIAYTHFLGLGAGKEEAGAEWACE